MPWFVVFEFMHDWNTSQLIGREGDTYKHYRQCVGKNVCGTYFYIDIYKKTEINEIIVQQQ
jgi:hypothetical protein